MIVCVCKSVSDRKIRAAIAEGADTFEALQFELGIGTCCGKCEPSAREVMAQCGLCETECGVERRAPSQPMHVTFYERKAA
ncbi:(2Fe-2S)-binding protein [Trinickia acidisoli]|uniref:(2Fe-2S)-binding protein n=1 Tax=Trinickia acidisoli TaxID=2767482 RepID=UPI001A8D3DC7|nr:(2Fe-2S)-binding protein [Trinickia acidisoli]